MVLGVEFVITVGLDGIKAREPSEPIEYAVTVEEL